MLFGQYFEAIPSYAVVDPVPDAIKVNSPHVGRTCFLYARAYPRLNADVSDFFNKQHSGCNQCFGQCTLN